MGIPVILASVNREVNMHKKGTSKDDVARDVPFAHGTEAPSQTVEEEEDKEVDNEEEEEEEETNCPPDGISSLPLGNFPSSQAPSLDLPSAQKNTPHTQISKFTFLLPPSIPLTTCAIFYLGSESLALNNILILKGENLIWSYDPESLECKLESSRSNRILMRRYAIVEKAKDADVIGILIGTLGICQSPPLHTPRIQI